MKALILAFAMFATSTMNSPFAGAQARIQNASFTPSWSRYPAPDAIVATLRQQFPHVQYPQLDIKCLAVTSDNQILLGESTPLTGTPSIQNPNSAFIVWYTGCLKLFLVGENMAFESALRQAPVPADRLKVAQDFATHQMIELCDVDNSFSGMDPNCAWQALPEARRLNAITAEIEKLIGPDDVIRDLGIAPSIVDLAKRIDQQLIKIIMNKPTAFTFLGLYLSPTTNGNLATPLRSLRAIQFLILLNDTLKY